MSSFYELVQPSLRPLSARGHNNVYKATSREQYANMSATLLTPGFATDAFVIIRRGARKQLHKHTRTKDTNRQRTRGDPKGRTESVRPHACKANARETVALSFPHKSEEFAIPYACGLTYTKMATGGAIGSSSCCHLSRWHGPPIKCHMQSQSHTVVHVCVCVPLGLPTHGRALLCFMCYFLAVSTVLTLWTSLGRAEHWK